MNPITNAKNLNKLNEKELNLGLTGSSTSWHNLYEESAWIFVGGLAYDMTEGDVLTVFSQYGEIVNINLVRDKKTGRPKGYCFICYEDQRSTILAVDNFNGIKLLNRIIRVDHVKDYRMPKEFGDEDELTRQVRSEGCGPGVQLTARVKREVSPEDDQTHTRRKQIKIKKEEVSDADDIQRHQNGEVHREANMTAVRMKEEPNDPGYEKYNRKEDKSRSHRGEPHKVRHQERHRSKTKTQHSSSEESVEFSRNRTSGMSGKDQRTRIDQTSERLEKRESGNQQDRIDSRKQMSESVEHKDWQQRKREDGSRYADASYRDADRRVTSHRSDTSAEKRSHDRLNDYHSDEQRRRIHRERSSDRHKRNHSSSTDEEEERRKKKKVPTATLR